jgi:hypothetical protein
LLHGETTTSISLIPLVRTFWLCAWSDHPNSVG